MYSSTVNIAFRAFLNWSRFTGETGMSFNNNVLKIWTGACASAANKRVKQEVSAVRKQTKYQHICLFGNMEQFHLCPEKGFQHSS